jgi:outer membrane protein OmpA-like peptidoglycan-associated protein
MQRLHGPFAAMRRLPWLAVLVLAACASAPADRVILLPAAEGRVLGGVTVKSSQADLLLDKALAQALVRRDGTAEPGMAKAEEVRERYAELLAHVPARPRSWVVYFETGSDKLVAQSENVLTEVRGALAKAEVPELVLIGHTDRVGVAAENDRLSLQRATALRELLIAAGFDARRIEVAGRGEREPLVTTADEVAEPRNRRVQVKLK